LVSFLYLLYHVRSPSRYGWTLAQFSTLSPGRCNSSAWFSCAWWPRKYPRKHHFPGRKAPWPGTHSTVGILVCPAINQRRPQLAMSAPAIMPTTHRVVGSSARLHG
jgi:hypothetical protein